VVEGRLDVGAEVTATVDAERRQAIRRAHSATHLLHNALHKHLGKHAQQAGSKVEPDRLRFDFSNPEAVGKGRLQEIEKTVNELVMTGAPVDWKLMPIAEAKTLGAMALFGEKYPEIVRVVRMGEFSRELCGGTHLDSVGQVGLFKILGEESVAAGTRRIIALTGKAALDFVRQEEEALSDVAATLRVPPAQVGGRIAALLEEVKTLKKQAAQRKPESGPKATPDELLAAARAAGEAAVVIAAVEANLDEMRVLVDGLRRKRPENLAVLLIAAVDGKVSLVSAFSQDLVAKGRHAGQWLKKVAPAVGGGGGGRPDMAQAGGKDPAKIPDALELAWAVVREELGG
jgi:alanyl-tRNA synthetase